MIHSLPRKDRARVRFLARRQWRMTFVPFAIVNIEGLGRSLVVMRRLETRWSQREGKRVWRTPAGGLAAAAAKLIRKAS